MKREDREKLLDRRIKWALFTIALLYFLLGLGFIYQAYAQTRVPVTIMTTRIEKVPSGSDDKAVTAFYNYLDIRRLATFEETHYVNPLLLSWVYGAIGVFLLVFYFLAFGWYARNRGGDLYPVEVYNGYISERGGPLDPFNYAVYALLGSYMIYYTVINLIYGQSY